jgi:GntR family transcriptional regulator/MocR family aminotransferase
VLAYADTRSTLRAGIMPREGTSLQAEWLAELIGPLAPLQQTLMRTPYRRLRSLLTTGSITAGQAMPASRTLAAQLKLSRNTVLAAYDQLIAEGFLEARAGSGTYAAAVASNQPHAPQTTSHPGLSARGLQLSRYAPPQREAQSGAFVPGVPALDAFPVTLWQRYQARYLGHPKRDWLGYSQDGGLPELRAALAEHLVQARGVRASADTILITHGAQQALELLARLLANPGDTAWVEDPGYSGAHAALAGADLKLCPVPVDEQGLNPNLAPHGYGTAADLRYPVASISKWRRDEPSAPARAVGQRRSTRRLDYRRRL